jgi:hypothetical protein
MRFSPYPDTTERQAQTSSQFRQFIFHSRRYNGMHRPNHKAVAFHLPQSLRQHLLADAADQLAQAGETNDAMLF